MIRIIFIVAFLFSQLISANAQLNINLVGQLTFPGHGDLSDIWGYVDGTGKEYAIVGTYNGTSIVDISTPAIPVEVFFSPGASSIWRDIKVWNNHAYITNESANGLKIIDMSNLPGAITPGDVYQFTGSTYPLSQAHNLYIDENGIAYIIGANYGVDGAIFLDLNPDPKNPVEVGRYNDYYLHDGMVRGDTLWAGVINYGFFVAVDVSNKSAPVTIATQSTPSFATHNCWISDNGQTLYTTDEVSNGFIGAYDVSDLGNISELDRVQSSPGKMVIPHNAHYMNDYVITSYYRDGITIHDVSNPSNMVEVGNYDTSPAFYGSGFEGCWGVYPYLPSGLIIASDRQNGLYVLDPTYVSASYLEGNIKDSITTFNLEGVQVDIISTSTFTNSNIIGNYQTGLATSGTYSVTFSKYGYQTKTITGVVFTAGNITTLNIELVPLVLFTLQGQVIEASSSNPIANANVLIICPLFDTTVQTNASGNFTIPNFAEDFYEVYIGKWGYNQFCSSNENLSSAGNTHIYQLSEGYYDDFTFDLGWHVTGLNTSGAWVKGIPDGTTYGGDLANPGEDTQTDCKDEAYVTGNGGGGASYDDVDGGVTALKSPIFDLSTYTDPYLHFDRWFYNGGGTATPNDSLVVYLNNGTNMVTIDFSTVTDTNMSTWSSKSIQVSSVTTATSTMQLIVIVKDITPEHIVEAGFDKFYIDESSGITTQFKENKNIIIFPNPFTDELTFNFNINHKNIDVEVFEVTGKMIDKKEFTNTSIASFKNNYKSGIYYIKVYGEGALIKTQKVIKL